MNDKKFTKLSQLVDDTFTVESVDEYSFKRWDPATSKMLVSYEWQKDYRKTPENIPDYLHRHVLRSAINGSFGENIARGSIQSGTKIIRNFKTNINPAYMAVHCSVVAFLVDSANAEVMQAEEKGILQ